MVNPFGKDILGKPVDVRKPSPMSRDFVVPPFSILNSRDAYWQSRKRAWIKFGIQGELGRGGEPNTNVFVDKTAPYGTLMPAADWSKNRARGSSRGKALPGTEAVYTHDKKYQDRLDKNNQFSEKHKKALGIYQAQAIQNRYTGEAVTGTSIFDPVLCELVYRWFCPKGGSIFDPFAGESTKGIVAAALEFKYTGIELRKEQVEANYKQANNVGLLCNWITGDSTDLNQLIPETEKYDLIFTSPPYYNLEVYSGGDSDGSTFGSYHQFMKWYNIIFFQAIQHLKNNRFLVVKVGEIRDKKTGIYYNFVADTISTMLGQGLNYYNEMILLTAINSLPVRAKRHFVASRKVGKAHQNILVFFKGTPNSSIIKKLFPEDIKC